MRKTQKEQIFEIAKKFGYSIEKSNEKNIYNNDIYFFEKQVEDITKGLKIFFNEVTSNFIASFFTENKEIISAFGPSNFTKTKKYFEGPKLYGEITWVEGSELKVGVGATLHFYSDAEAFTIVEVINDKKVVVRGCEGTLKPEWKPDIQAGGFSGHCSNNRLQQYDYKDILTAGGRVFTLRSNGNWCEEGQSSKSSRLVLGRRRKFHDYNF